MVEKGEAGSGATMIQVPSVQVGGLTTGPVWFTQRADRNFLDYMSQWTDRTVVGALGGNALCSFRILLDIPCAVESSSGLSEVVLIAAAGNSASGLRDAQSGHLAALSSS